jgi:DNA polymerase-3 subunit delta'
MGFSKKAAFDSLQRAVKQNRLAHAYMIIGPDGSGKRALVRELSALVVRPNADEQTILSHPDVHVAEPESKSRRIVIEQVRALEKELQMRSSGGGKKVGVIFDADRLQIQASNAFLKTLEEPPDNSLLLLTSSIPEILPDTIISRCIPLTLQAAAAPETPRVQRLLGILKENARTEKGGVPQVFRLVREFIDLLHEARQQIYDQHDSEFKKEEQQYRQATDGAWLEEREDYYKALTESRYLRERALLLEVLLQWWADVLRHQQGDAHFDYPKFAADTQLLAQRFSITQTLERIGALEELREHFDRNIQEQLAIEVTFLKLFTW